MQNIAALVSAVEIAEICPSQPDPAACAANIKKYLPDVTRALYKFAFIEHGQDLCTAIGGIDACTVE